MLKISLTKSGYATLKQRDLYAQDDIINEFQEKIRQQIDEAIKTSETKDELRDMDRVEGTKKDYRVAMVLKNEYAVVYSLTGDQRVKILAIGRVSRNRLTSDKAITALINSSLTV